MERDFDKESIKQSITPDDFDGYSGAIGIVHLENEEDGDAIRTERAAGMRSGTVPVDEYVRTDRSLGVEMRKFADLAELVGDDQLAGEVARAESAMDEAKVRLDFALSNAGYIMATGIIKRLLEEGYFADSSVAESGVNLRVVTYEQGVLGVSADATMAVKTDTQGTKAQDADGRFQTIHGKLDGNTIEYATGIINLEVTAQPNLDLMRSIQDNYGNQVERAFSEGKPLMFEPINKRDITELL